MRRALIFTWLLGVAGSGLAHAQQPAGGATTPRPTGTTAAQPPRGRPAQPPPPRRAAPPPFGPRFRVSVNAGLQVAGPAITQDFSYDLNADQARIVNEIATANGVFVDVGLAYTLTRTGVAAGVAFSATSRTSSSELTAELPHPFYFTDRTVQATVNDLKGSEQGVHIFLSYPVPRKPTSALEVSLFGGPSLFTVKQDLVTSVVTSESYPYDDVTLTSATLASPRPSATAFGFNVGTDVSWRLTPTLRVGGLLRFTRGTATLDDGFGDEVSVDAGGLMAGAGIRVIF